MVKKTHAASYKNNTLGLAMNVPRRTLGQSSEATPLGAQEWTAVKHYQVMRLIWQLRTQPLVLLMNF